MDKLKGDKMNTDLEIFVITNGRSTYEYCLQSILKQTIRTTFTVIRDRKWKDALHEIMERCQSSYFLRVDDDFILHKQAVEFILESLKLYGTENIAQYCYHLWEIWTGRRITGVKLYSMSAMKSIGGHQFNKYGRTDKKTNEALRDAGYVLARDSSIIGFHTCGTWKEQRRYEKLWQKASKKSYHKSTNLEMKKYCKTHLVSRLANLAPKFLQRANKVRVGKCQFTNFYYFLKDTNLLESLELKSNGIKIG